MYRPGVQEHEETSTEAAKEEGGKRKARKRRGRLGASAKGRAVGASTNEARGASSRRRGRRRDELHVSRLRIIHIEPPWGLDGGARRQRVLTQ